MAVSNLIDNFIEGLFRSRPEALKQAPRKITRPKSAQTYLEIAEIRDGVVVLKNGALRAVLMVSSINFALKSLEEQDAIIYHFQHFLNSLDFPIQIVINSRRLNIEEYYQILAIKEKEQTNELLRMQIAEYREYIKGLVEMANIVSKTFYIVIPFAPVEEKEKGFVEKFKAGGTAITHAIRLKEEEFQKSKTQLWQRVDHIIAGLSGVGIRLTPLNTQELIELYYTLYNPDISEKKGLVDVNALDMAQ